MRSHDGVEHLQNGAAVRQIDGESPGIARPLYHPGAEQRGQGIYRVR